MKEINNMDTILLLQNKKIAGSPFTKEISFKIIEIIEALDGLSTRDEFIEIFRSEIRKLIPHEMAVFGVGEWKTFRVDGVINVDFPEKFLEGVMKKTSAGLHIHSPVVKAAAQARHFIEVKNTRKFDPKSIKWTEAVAQNNIVNLLGKGRKHPGGTRYTFHSYGNSPTEWSDHGLRIVNILTPHIDSALLKILGMEILDKTIEISLREKEILQYLSLGYKNEQIAGQLFISLHTVKNHIKHILAKLGVQNRTQAVAKAIDFDLIQTS